MLIAPAAGLIVAVLAAVFAEATGKPTADVLFSWQSQMGTLIDHAAAYSVGTLVLLLICKGLAYGVSLGSFRGGPTFPGMFMGAAGRPRAIAPTGTAASRRRRHGLAARGNRPLGFIRHPAHARMMETAVNAPTTGPATKMVGAALHVPRDLPAVFRQGGDRWQICAAQ